MLDEMAIMEMLFGGFITEYLSTDEDGEEDELDEVDDFEDPLFFGEFISLSDDTDNFGYDYGWD